jgi:hypothetical protein
MGRIQVQLTGSSPDLKRMHDHLSYHVKEITDSEWGNDGKQKTTKFTITI